MSNNDSAALRYYPAEHVDRIASQLRELLDDVVVDLRGFEVRSSGGRERHGEAQAPLETPAFVHAPFTPEPDRLSPSGPAHSQRVAAPRPPTTTRRPLTQYDPSAVFPPPRPKRGRGSRLARLLGASDEVSG